MEFPEGFACHLLRGSYPRRTGIISIRVAFLDQCNTAHISPYRRNPLCKLFSSPGVTGRAWRSSWPWRSSPSQHSRPVHRPRTTRLSKRTITVASQWTSQKVGKLVFDTAVTPRWLETGDRFWYAYQTPQGRNFYLVDPAKKSKALLFDNAKMAAMLTAITRIPYDSQHLPFSTITRFVKKDAAFEFQFTVPADADIVMTKKPVQETAKKEEVAQQPRPAGPVNGVEGDRGAGAQLSACRPQDQDPPF